MDMKVKRGRELSAEEFSGLLSLDCKLYGSRILTNRGMALKRFLKFRDGIFALYAGDTLAGFVCFYNVHPRVYERALSGRQYMDDNLRDSEVLPLTKEQENHILLFDLVIDEPFQGQGLSKLLFGLIGDYLKQKSGEGYETGRIFGYAITPRGFQILSSCGGTGIWTKGDITLFEVDKKVFMGLRG